MRVLVINDIHGRTIWEDIVAKESENVDIIVFDGDYFDTHENYSVDNIISNWMNIHKYQQSNDKVLLLCGNHDYHLFDGINEKYESLNIWQATKFGLGLTVLNNVIENICYQVPDTDILISHAGVSPKFLENHGLDKNGDIALQLNTLFKEDPGQFSFMVNGRFDNYGDEPTQSPIWIRPASLMSACQHFPYRQIVGHTTQKQILNVNNKYYFADCLGTSKEYIIIVNGEIQIHKL